MTTTDMERTRVYLSELRDRAEQQAAEWEEHSPKTANVWDARSRIMAAALEQLAMEWTQ